MEFGAVEFYLDENGDIAKPVEYHSFLINPEKTIPREVSDVTGIFNHHVDDKPVFAEVAQKIWDCIDNSILVAHNFNFDFGFIRNEFRRLNNGKEWPNTIAEFDTLKMAQVMLPKLQSKRLGKVSEHLGIPLVQAHRATDDAEACGRVFIEMCNRFNAPDDLFELCKWGIGVCSPPKNQFISIGNRGMPEFSFGKNKGKLIEEEMTYLHWMTLAKSFESGQWSNTFSEKVRDWIKVWLKGRTAGSPTEGKYSESYDDWNPDPI